MEREAINRWALCWFSPAETINFGQDTSIPRTLPEHLQLATVRHFAQSSPQEPIIFSHCYQHQSQFLVNRAYKHSLLSFAPYGDTVWAVIGVCVCSLNCDSKNPHKCFLFQLCLFSGQHISFIKSITNHYVDHES